MELKEELLFVRNDVDIFLCERARLPWYERSVEERIHFLANQWGIDKVSFSENDVIIDCGANIGEIGIYLRVLPTQVKYIAFEPGKKEYAACVKNNPEFAAIHSVGLWMEDGEKEFYVKSDTADSSIIPIENFTDKVSISVRSLDSIFSEFGIRRCRVLKIEAEGAEPEVLKGALNALSLCDYVFVDTGPERGIGKETTTVEVFNILSRRDFELFHFEHKRCILGFRRKLYERK